MLQNANISDKHFALLVSKVVVSNSERNEKLAQHKKKSKMDKIGTDENQDNPPLIKPRKNQFKCSSWQRSVKQAFSHDHASSSKQTLPRKTFQRNQNALSIESYKVTF